MICLIFKNYTETLDGKNKITLLSPKKYSEGYFVETGWVSSSKNIELPSSNTSWKVEGNNKLTPGNPVTLVWNNNQGISFKKKIKIDEKFLFSIDQIITNQSEKSYDFYAYGQIIRNKSPEVTNFYILHEGLIGVLNDQLVEKDYDDIEEKEFSQKAGSDPRYLKNAFSADHPNFALFGFFQNAFSIFKSLSNKLFNEISTSLNSVGKSIPASFLYLSD